MNGKDINEQNNPVTRTLQAKIINGKVWIKEEGLPGGYVQLPDDDPRYRETRNQLDHNQRFIEMLDWVYNRRHQKPQKPQRNERYTPDDERYYYPTN
jgi:hypothetical protein